MRRRLNPSSQEHEPEEILDPAQQQSIVEDLVAEAKRSQVLFNRIARWISLILAVCILLYQPHPVALSISSATALLLSAFTPDHIRVAPDVQFTPILFALVTLVALVGLYIDRQATVWIVPLAGMGIGEVLKFTGWSTVEEAKALDGLRYEAPEA